MASFGQRIRDLRKVKELTQRELAEKVGINFTYLSKIENDKLEHNQFPREETIKNLCDVLDGDLNELLLLAQRIPDTIKQRVFQRPDAFRKIASLDDQALDRLLKGLGE